jgi:hypothetical protein
MRTTLVISATLLLLLTACGGDGNEADRVGVGASCTSDGDCPTRVCGDGGACPPLVCLTQFTGGYCGFAGCVSHDDCPVGSACVIHDDGMNYCFRTCENKPECNVNRGPEEESNCSSSVDWVTDIAGKACVPPSSGI